MDKLRSVIDERKKGLAELYSKHPIGVAFFLENQQNDSDETDNWDKTGNEMFEELILNVILMQTLEENGVAELNKETHEWTILEKKQFDELVDEVLLDAIDIGSYP